jgi:hypothetical protein
MSQENILIGGVYHSKDGSFFYFIISAINI